MRIYTRGGDKGQTSLIGRDRRYKDDLRVDAYGTVDEAGAFIGLAVADLACDSYSDIQEVLVEVQQMLWNVGADLAALPGAKYEVRTHERAAGELEPLIDRYKEEADRIDKFILRGGVRAAATLHVACTVVRRAERRTVALMRAEEIHLPVLAYLNRLSDLLFVLARAVNARAQEAEITYTNSPDVFK